jgi:glyceraldehyde-3-phosphate dehydrogenase (NAD(P))
MDNNILVVGTGTIGEPLTGLLSIQKSSLGIDNVLFYKHTPRRTDLPLVLGLLRKGATLCTNRENFEKFREMGVEPTYTFEEALDVSPVVCDCSPTDAGLANKEKFYKDRVDKNKAFLAQGSEFGFGPIYASGINDNIIRKNKFLQIASCNTHNISNVLKNLAFKPEERTKDTLGPSYLKEANFLAIRRASDISQAEDFIPSPEVGSHKDPVFGTHHARDALHLFKTLGYDENSLNLFSSAIKLNTQFMHTLYFDIRLKDQKMTKEEVIKRFIDDPYTAITYKKQASQVFSFGREHGHFGRILDQSVVVLPTLLVQNERPGESGSRIVGYCFTPQDGNSLLSSATAITHYLHESPEEATEMLNCLTKYQFDEV